MAYHDLATVKLAANSRYISLVIDDDKDGIEETGRSDFLIAASDQEVYSTIYDRYAIAPSTVTVAGVNQMIRYAAAVLTVQKMALVKFKTAADEWAAEIRDWLEDVAASRKHLGDLASTNVFDSLRKNDLRFYRQKGQIDDYGEPAPGTTSNSTSDNGFISGRGKC